MVLTNQTKKPTVDVVIPVFNGALFIEKALTSVDKQTYQASSIIVIDDGSTDNTKTEVSNFAKTSKTPVVYIYQTNGGPNKARNNGMHSSNADLLAFLDADDEWIETKLERQIQKMETSEFENTGLIYCDYRLINENSQPLIDKSAVSLDTNYKGFIFEKLLTANKIIGSASAVLIKRECFESLGGFDESLKASEDWDMWIRIAEHFAINYVNEPLVKIRRHQNNFQKKYQYMLVNDILFYNKWIGKLKPSQVPTNWKDNIATLIFLGLPSLTFLPLAKKTLTPLSHKVLFQKYGGIELYLSIAILKKIFKLLREPRSLLSKLKLLNP